MKKLMMWPMMLVGIIAFIIILSRGGSSPTGSRSDPLVGTPSAVTESDNIKGVEFEATPSAVLIEYSDFQCPFCGEAQPILKQLVEQYPEDLQFVYRHFPLTTIHRNAEPAALASEAAANQGKFWEMHDKIFENQTQWSDAINPNEFFLTYAEELELDIEQFQADLESDETLLGVRENAGEALNINVQSTPTFFLNGEQLNIQSLSYELFKQAIDLSISAN